MANILVIHGPNLNLLGQREPEIYGNTTLDEINKQLTESAQALGHSLECFQSNSESDIVSKLHAHMDTSDFLIINPAALTHTSVALRDAIISCQLPTVEVHLSNIFRREAFRTHSFISDIAIGVCSGLGHRGYLAALDFANHHLTQK